MVESNNPDRSIGIGSSSMPMRHDSPPYWTSSTSLSKDSSQSPEPVKRLPHQGGRHVIINRTNPLRAQALTMSHF